MAFAKLSTDRQFEQAFLSHCTVYVREKSGVSDHFIGSIFAFNPVIVTVGGQPFSRDRHQFMRLK
ncbi:hypothetical protein [Paenibacillus thalictri]|uniref:Uncharacterized protein n=1 Tax=Paenibacillus thalictri TaxID=2527873 RepID=A0A4V2J4I8_9BACL|nr:hypothetical protein [Paenibacillus thalictri]TBL80002.1 hypothetical protein EYB31_10500 [Paenibacillus thalictri]